MKNEISIITGGGTGIGRALSLKFTGNNHKVLAVGRRTEKLEETYKMVADKDLFHYISADVAEQADREKIIEFASNYSVKYLVHNAAILGKIEYLQNMTIENWRSVLTINLEAPLFLTRELLPYMHDSRILHISSGAAHNAMKGWAPYCASKSALHMLYRIWNEELQDKNIFCGSLRPGVVNTEMQSSIRQADIEKFPFLKKFHDFYKNNELENTNQVANFIFWVLTATTNDQFTDSEWNIRDEYHHKHWNR